MHTVTGPGSQVLIKASEKGEKKYFALDFRIRTGC